MGMIYWKDALKKGYKIKGTKTGWIAGNRNVFWHGQEAAKAQAALRKAQKN